MMSGTISREAQAYRRIEEFINKINIWLLFGLIFSMYLIMTLISNQLIMGNDIFFRSYSDQFSHENLEIMFNIKERYEWMGYVFIPLLLFIKVTFATICISIGNVLSNIDFKFKTVFKAALLAEVIFIVAQVWYLTNLSFHLDTLTLETASNYYPLSALSYFGTENVVQWLHYPLQTLNLFEIFYMVTIAWLLAKQWNEDFMESLAIIVPS
jgi:hypothetical protein